MTSRALIAGGIASLILVSACGNEVPESHSAKQANLFSADGSCGPYEGVLQESSDFTPFELQRSAAGDDTVLLNPEGLPAPKIPDGVALASVRGQPLQWAIATDAAEYYQFFSKTPVTARTTVHDFRAGGGISVEITPIANMSLSELSKQVGDRAATVRIGDAPGIVVWADPTDDSGIRLHHVYWEQDKQLFGLLINTDAAQAITTARQIAWDCCTIR